jgi:hypothetical protein
MVIELLVCIGQLEVPICITENINSQIAVAAGRWWGSSVRLEVEVEVGKGCTVYEVNI